MIGYAPSLGQVVLAPKVSQSRSHFLSVAVSPIFDVELSYGKNKETVQAILDTGFTAAHLKIPQELANSLGLPATGTMNFTDATGSKEVSIGKITLIRAAGGNCSLANGKVLITGDRVVVGQPFLAGTGALIFYDKDGMSLSCGKNGAPGASGVFPQFSLQISNKGKQSIETAIVDTGFEGGLAIPESLAKKLAITQTGTKKFITHYGAVEMGISQVERVAFPDQPKCGASNLEVTIWPESSALKPVMVGEAFLKGMGGAAIGYDKDGALLACLSENMLIRAAKTVYIVMVSPELLPDLSKPSILVSAEQGISWPLIALGGVAAAGVLTFFLLRG